jgi:hypothetical protein
VPPICIVTGRDRTMADNAHNMMFCAMVTAQRHRLTTLSRL